MEIRFEDCVGVFADTVVDACGSCKFEVSSDIDGELVSLLKIDRAARTIAQSFIERQPTGLGSRSGCNYHGPSDDPVIHTKLSCEVVSAEEPTDQGSESD